MLNDKFENRIRESAGEIFGESKELPAGHRERFEQRLKSFRMQYETESQIPDCPIGIENTIQPEFAESVSSAGSKLSSVSAEHSVTAGNPGTIQKSAKVISLRNWMAASVAVVAVIAAFIILLNPSVENQSGPALADVCNYYNMQLEEQADATRQLVMQVDEAHREVWLTNIEQIENDPVPDVQITDEEYIVLIADVYTNKIEILQNMQNIIREII